jgi:hypothetical protein
VEVKSQNLADLLAGVKYARKQAGVSVVSMSWGAPEWSSETYYDSYFTTPSGHIGGSGLPGGITFVAATGDHGEHVQWPATSPYVLAVGGTTLTLDGTGNYQGEQGWYLSGGGISQYEARPGYQYGVQTTVHRTNPDVALIGNWSDGAEIYNTTDGGWESAGGTSLGTPIWAGLIAVADQGRNLGGLGSLGPGQTQTLIYRLPTSDFHDVTSGSNGYSAHAGYDLVTGRGTPFANLIIPYLLGSASNTVVTATKPVSGSLGSATPAGRAGAAPAFAAPSGAATDSPTSGGTQPTAVGAAVVWMGFPTANNAVEAGGGRLSGIAPSGLPVVRASSERLGGGSGADTASTQADLVESPADTFVPTTGEAETNPWGRNLLLPPPAGRDSRPADVCFADDGWVDSIVAPAAGDVAVTPTAENQAGHPPLALASAAIVLGGTWLCDRLESERRRLALA